MVMGRSDSSADWFYYMLAGSIKNYWVSSKEEMKLLLQKAVEYHLLEEEDLYQQLWIIHQKDVFAISMAQQKIIWILTTGIKDWLWGSRIIPITYHKMLAEDPDNVVPVHDTYEYDSVDNQPYVDVFYDGKSVPRPFPFWTWLRTPREITNLYYRYWMFLNFQLGMGIKRILKQCDNSVYLLVKFRIPYNKCIQGEKNAANYQSTRSS